MISMTAISSSSSPSTLLSDLAKDLSLPGVCPQCKGGALAAICWGARMVPHQMFYSCRHVILVLVLDPDGRP
jgi:hypothetical protein